MTDKLALLTCDFCGEPFLGPPLSFLEEWFYRVELATKYCGSECAIASIEAGLMAESARALR